jgi:filamentous hemagglutinin
VVANANPKNFSDGNVPINFNRPIGEGYTGNRTANRGTGIPVGEYRWTTTATVRIDTPTGKAFTAYPNLSLGVAKPDPLNNGVRP